MVQYYTDSADIDPVLLERIVTGGSEPNLPRKPRSVDKDKHDRADRESRKIMDAERLAREAKTYRLRDQRLADVCR